jgi:alkanesulfonate monooxygenase SsuD/methylene tetrahydromethanopterin reductase-like flavin-dependent oxidoreductase (luciferase family)
MKQMKFGFVLPYGDARAAADLAHQAEDAGWDGFFVWEPVWGVDAWVSLAAAAMQTTTIRLGTMLTPLSRLRPWKLASETAALDNLSGGRVILSVGLGAVDTGFEAFGEVTDRKTRAELLDEGLDILTGLWNGQPFHYTGKHYRVEETDFYPPPPPIQQPRIPIWVVGAFPFEKSMQRAMQYDGLLPMKLDPETRQMQALAPPDLAEIVAYVRTKRAGSSPYDIIWEGNTPGDDPGRAAGLVQPWEQAGATWWIETMWDVQDLGRVAERIRQGPPTIYP